MKAETAGKGFLFFLVIGLPFVYSSQLLDQGLTIRFIVIACASLFLSIVFSVNYIQNKVLKSINNPILILIGIYVFYLAFRVSQGFIFGDALFVWLKTSLFFIFLFLVYQLFSFKTAQFSISFGLAILGFILTSWGLFELFSIATKGNFEMPFSTYEIITAFEHRNLYAQILFLTLPFQLLKTINQKNKLSNITFLISSIGSFFLLIILSSRAIWLATSVSFLFTTLIFIWSSYKNSVDDSVLNKTQIIKLVAVFVLGISFAFIFIQTVNSSTKLKSHSEEIFNPEKGTTKQRFELWSRSMDLFKESPVFGKGLANWKIEVLKYDHEGLVSEDNLTFFQRPHNDYIWVLVESGLVGLFIFLTIVALIIYQIVQFIFKSNNPKDKLFFSSVLMAFSGYLIFSFFSFPMERIYHHLIITLFIAAILLYHPIINENTKSLITIVLLVVVLLISLGSIAVGIYRYNGEKQLKKAMIAKNERNYPLILSEIDKAENRFYQMDPTSTPLSWYSGFAFFKLENNEKAKMQFLKAFSLNPYHIHVLNNLASSYFLLNKSDSAIYYYNKAVKIAPNFDESWFNLAAVYFNNNDYQMAYESLKKVNLFTTDSRYRPFIKTIIRTLIRQEIENSEYENRYTLPDDEAWYFEIHKQLRNENKSLKNIIFENHILPPKQ